MLNFHRSSLKSFAFLIKIPVMCGQQNKKMSVRDTVEELTQVCIQLHRTVNSTSDSAAKEKLVLQHIKTFTEEENYINDFQKGLEWFNVSEPLSVKKHLDGKITVLDFFTYCCINCMHILPELDALEKKYSAKDGLAVIGVHSAKFSNEKESAKILSAVQRYNIAHPVVNDAKLSMWRDIGIACWPSLVMLGPKGQPLFVFVGEGHKDDLFLYTKVALEYFKSLNQISDHLLPIKSAQHLLPVTKDILLFPGKVNLYKDKLVVSDSGNNRILIMDANGKVDYVVGDYAPGFEDGSFTEAKFAAPQGVCVLDDCIFVADSENHAIRKINLTDKTVSTIAGIGTQGHDYSGGKIGKNQELSSPWDVAIYQHKQDGKDVPVLLIAIAGIHQIWALFLEDTVWWKEKEYKSGTCVAIVGNGTEENRNNSYAHAACLAQPSGLAVTQELESVFFADSESSSIRRVHLADGKVSAVCGADKNPANLHDFGDVDGHQYSAKLQHPLGVAWDPFKKVVYVADTYNHKIKQVDIDGNCTTLYGAGKPCSDFCFDEPSGLAVHSNGKILYVTNTNNHSLEVIDMENQTIRKISVTLPPEIISDSNKKHSFDALISPNGGELNISFEFVFQDSKMKLNPEAPQKWSLQSPPNGWSAPILNGDVVSPITLTIPKGEEQVSLHVTLDLMTCKEDECKPIKLSAIFNVYRGSDAPDNVIVKKELKIK